MAQPSSDSIEAACEAEARQDVLPQRGGTPEIRDAIQRIHATALSVGDAPIEISEDDSQYDLFYLGKKMAQISSRLEGCSGLQTKLQLCKIELVAKLFDLDHSEDLCRAKLGKKCAKDAELRELERQRRDCRTALSMHKAVSKIVDDRVVVLRHLESGLHFQGKVLQAKAAVGAIPEHQMLFAPDRHGFAVTGDDYEDA